jgi:hypothetical protein
MIMNNSKKILLLIIAGLSLNISDLIATSPSFGQSSINNSIPGNSNKQISDKEILLILNRRKKDAEYQGELIAPGNGNQNYKIIRIDTTDFTEGGTLRIDIQVGSGKSSASFDLFAEDAVVPIAGRPTESLNGSYDISPETGTSLTYRFDRGEVFQFGATGNWFSKKGSRNSYKIKAYVIPK